MARISYDPEVNILSIRLLDKKSVDSDMQDDVVLDYDEKGDLVNIDVMNFHPEIFFGKSKKTL